MPPRFMQRLERQAAVYRGVFGEAATEPPPYPNSPRPGSLTSESSGKSPLIAPPQYAHIREDRLEQSPWLAGPPDAIVPRDSLILVTAANSFQGLHIVDRLLAHGYRVRGAVRDASKAVWTSKLFKVKYGPGRYTTAVIPDMVPRDAYDLAVRNCAGVVHCASVTTPSLDPIKVIVPSIAGALNALNSAAREPTVLRFVYCSAAVAAVDPGSGYRSDVAGDSWNMDCFQKAWSGGVKPEYTRDMAWTVQCASKLQTEQAVWRWYRDTNPRFVLNSVLPGMLWGENIAPEASASQSVDLLKTVFHGNAASTAWSPPRASHPISITRYSPLTQAEHFVNPRDSALLHVAALLLPNVQHQRVFAVAQAYNINSLLDALRTLYPNHVFPGDVSDHGDDMSDFREKAISVDLLRRMGQPSGFTDLSQSLRECCSGWL